MLKGVKKGIKKKIKGKKDKKEDDLFDPEQLEKYKRELEEAKKARQQQEDESGLSGAAGSSGSAGHEEDEEWLRFKQLTSGVDVLVNKVSTDLDRIKESSFFQRNKPSEQNKLFASEHPSKAIPVQEEEVVPEPETEEAEGETKAPEDEAGDDEADALKVPESPEIVPVELDDSLFDTEFVDAIATGEIKLAYIPDSPTQEDDDDPFDTHVYDTVVKKIEEEEKKAKRQVNLDNVVDVLTGKGGKTGIERPRTKAGELKPKARPRPHAVNLLGDFDDAPTPPPTDYSKNKSNVKVESKTVDVFDQILGSPVKDTSSPLLEKIDILSAQKPIEEKKEKNESSKDNGIKDVISEFDVISELDPIVGGGAGSDPIPVGVPASIPSSIAALLTTTTAPAEPEEDEFDDEFAALAAESIHKGPPPPVEPPADDNEEEEDPFDTSFVDKSAPHGKCELKIIEDEFLGDPQSSDTKDSQSTSNEKKLTEDDDDDFNPRFGESPPKTLLIQNAPKVNPLEDMSPSAVKAPAIQPHVKAVGPTLVDGVDGKETEKIERVDEDIDPFDTSRLEAALPGKAELKLLEEELLSAQELQKEPPKLPETIVSAIAKKQATVDDDFDFDPRKDEVKHHVLDLHDAEHHAFDNVSKVMTPQQEKEVELDPFDTSTVDALGLIPGALEMKLLENELISPTKETPQTVQQITNVVPAPVKKFAKTFSDDEDDFDPRGGIPAPVIAEKPPEDIFDSAMDFAVDKPLTPQQEMPSTAIPEPKLCPTNSDDPFDTSGIQIENYLAKSELKQVEEELLNAPPEQSQPPRTLPCIVAVEYKKPPQQVAPTQPPPPPAPAHPLEAMTPIEDSIKPLTPVEMPHLMTGVVSVFNPSPMADPFDTSIADVVMPGKTEIKLLEEELGVGAGIPRSLSDDDFNPRQPNHPSNQMISQPLTPMPAATSNDDPFDTSAAEKGTPCKAQLKALEAELL